MDAAAALKLTDVNQYDKAAIIDSDGSVTVYDDALILRVVVGFTGTTNY